jgi:hypothetical protein
MYAAAHRALDNPLPVEIELMAMTSYLRLREALSAAAQQKDIAWTTEAAASLDSLTSDIVARTCVITEDRIEQLVALLPETIRESDAALPLSKAALTVYARPLQSRTNSCVPAYFLIEPGPSWRKLPMGELKPELRCTECKRRWFKLGHLVDKYGNCPVPDGLLHVGCFLRRGLAVGWPEPCCEPVGTDYDGIRFVDAVVAVGAAGGDHVSVRVPHASLASKLHAKELRAIERTVQRYWRRVAKLRENCRVLLDTVYGHEACNWLRLLSPARVTVSAAQAIADAIIADSFSAATVRYLENVLDDIKAQSTRAMAEPRILRLLQYEELGLSGGTSVVLDVARSSGGAPQRDPPVRGVPAQFMSMRKLIAMLRDMDDGAADVFVTSPQLEAARPACTSLYSVDAAVVRQERSQRTVVLKNSRVYALHARTDGSEALMAVDGVVAHLGEREVCANDGFVGVAILPEAGANRLICRIMAFSVYPSDPSQPPRFVLVSGI